jgi:hypothetical protein
MLRFRGKVELLDGSEIEFVAGSASIAAWERYAIKNGLPHGADSPAAFSDLVVAHHAMAVADPLDAWMENVLSVELVQEKDVPPTTPEASPAGS